MERKIIAAILTVALVDKLGHLGKLEPSKIAPEELSILRTYQTILKQMEHENI